MPTKKPPPPDQRPQSEDFIETARKLGADESREGFERVFEKIARAAPVKGSGITNPPLGSLKAKR